MLSRACSVYCEGPLLQTVQLSGLYNDSKTFVDMPMRVSPEDTLSAFYSLSDPANNRTELELFLNEYFDPTGSDLIPWLPPDFTDNPALINDMHDSYIYKNWTYDLNQLWKVLGRNVSQAVLENPEQHSFLPRGHAMVVPGGRFRESYYWDSLWIVRGLLISEMFNTSRGVIENLLEDVDHFGFVPNGGRIYYLDRSQPPLLSEMVWTYYTHCLPLVDNEISSVYRDSERVYNEFANSAIGVNDNFVDSEVRSDAKSGVKSVADHGDSANTGVGNSNPGVDSTNPGVGSANSGVQMTKHELLSFLNTSFHLLQREYDWWMNETNGHVVTLINNEDVHGTLNRYHSALATPRPESYAVDYIHAHELASIYPFNSNAYNTTRDSFYREIRAGAETGWDFSSRWLENAFNLTSIHTTNIVPVELNAILYRMELNLVEMESVLRRNGYAPVVVVNYTRAARERYVAIQSFLWDDEHFHWRDFNLSTNSWAEVTGLQQGTNFSTIAYFLPLWAKIYPPPPTVNLTSILDEDSPFIPWKYEPSRAIKHKLVRAVRGSGLIQAAGVLTTTLDTGEQWDAPNAWPPLVLMTIEGLRGLRSAGALVLANNITTNWLNTCYLAYESSGYMYEKYNAYEVGVGGGGGEYTPQIGFGWSNAVALVLINATYRNGSIPQPIDPSDDSESDTQSVALIVSLSVLLPLLFVCVVGYVYYWHFVRRDPEGEKDTLMTGLV